MKKGIKIALIVAAVLVALYFGAQWFLAHKIRQVIEKELPTMSGGYYQGKVGKVKVCLINRSVKLKDIRIKSDIYDRPDTVHMPNLNLSIDKIALTGIHFKLKKENRQLRLRALKITSPYVSFVPSEVKPEKDPSDTLSLGQKITQALALLEIKRIEIRNGHYDNYLNGIDTGKGNYADGLNLTAYGFKIDRNGPADGKILFCDDIEADGENIRFLITQGFNSLEIDNLDMSTRTGNLDLSAFRMMPQLSKTEFAHKAPRHADWTQITSGAIHASGLDIEGYLNNGTVRINTITVESGDVQSYKNRKIQRVEWYKKLLHETLADLPFKLYVDRLTVANMTATYEELAVNGIKPGRIFFTDLKGEFQGLTNIADASDPTFKFDASGNLMGQGHLSVHFRIPKSRENEHFTVNGTLSQTDLTVINQMIEPLAFMRVRSGTVDRLDFSVSANPATANTQLTLLYHNLNVVIEKNDDGEVTNRIFLSDLANFILIKDANPDRWGTRHVKSVTQRDPLRSQFNYLWKMLFPGLKRTIGIPDKSTELESDDLAVGNYHGRPPVRTEGIFDRDKDNFSGGEDVAENRREIREQERSERRLDRSNNSGEDAEVETHGIFQRRRNR